MDSMVPTILKIRPKFGQNPRWPPIVQDGRQKNANLIFFKVWTINEPEIHICKNLPKIFTLAKIVTQGRTLLRMGAILIQEWLPFFKKCAIFYYTIIKVRIS